MGQKDGEITAESATESKSPEHPIKVEDKEAENDGANIDKAMPTEEENEELKVIRDDNITEKDVGLDTNTVDDQKVKSEPMSDPVESHLHTVEKAEIPEAVPDVLHGSLDMKPSDNSLDAEEESKSAEEDEVEVVASVPEEPNRSVDVVEGPAKDSIPAEKTVEDVPPTQLEIRDIQAGGGVEPSDSTITVTTEAETTDVFQSVNSSGTRDDSARMVHSGTDALAKPVEVIPQSKASEFDVKQQHRKVASDVSDYPDTVQELEKVKMEMKMMETALQGAARQAQVRIS